MGPLHISKVSRACSNSMMDEKLLGDISERKEQQLHK